MVTSKQVNSSLVFYDDTREYRWVDACGPDVVKFIEDLGTATDDTTGDPDRWVQTVTEAGAGDSTVVNAAAAGAALLLTTDAAEYDGINLQAKGEAFKLVAGKPLYFGAKFKVSDATQSDVLVGLAETHGDLVKTGAAHGIAAADVEGVFLWKVDGGTVLTAKTYKDAAETATANYATALADDTYITFEIYWDGTTVYFYIDGTLVTSVAASLPDGDLTPSINIRAGAAAAKTMTVAWVRCIQVR